MKNLFLTIVISIFSIFSGLSQKYLLRYKGKIASCPIEGCNCSQDRSTEGGEDMPVKESFEHILYKSKYNNLNWSKEFVLLDPFDGLWIVPM